MIIQRTAIIRLLLIMAINSTLHVSQIYAASGSAAYQSMIAEMPWNVKKVSSEVRQQSIDSKSNLDIKHTTEKYKKAIVAQNGSIATSLQIPVRNENIQKKQRLFKNYSDSLFAAYKNIPEDLWKEKIAPSLGLHKDIPLISNAQYRLGRHGTFLHSVFWSPDGNKVATTSRDNTTKICDARNGQLLQTLQGGHRGPVSSISWSPDGSKIATASYDHTAKIWNASNGQLLHTLKGHGGYLYSVSWSPDGNNVAAASGDYSAKIWDARNGQLLQDHGDLGCPVSWSPDGSMMATTSWDRSAKIWDARNRQLMHTLEGHGDRVDSVSWSPDGSKLATTSLDCSAKIWNARNRQSLHTLRGHGDKVRSLSWSPDGSKVATLSSDHTAKIWNANNGKLLHAFQIHWEGVHSVCWSSDGSKIAIALWNGTVNIWNVSNGQLLHTLKGHGGKFFSVSWSPDGSKVANASGDYSVKIWNVDFLNEKTYKDFCDGKLTREQCTFLIWLSDKRARSNCQLTLSSELSQTFKAFHPVVQESIKKHYNLSIIDPEARSNNVSIAEPVTQSKNQKKDLNVELMPKNYIWRGIWGLAAIGIGYGMYKWIKG